jgi:HlyD family secretion protein
MLNRLYDRHGVSVVRKVLIGASLFILVAVSLIIYNSDSEAPTEEEVDLPSVTLGTVRDLGNESNFSIVGTVRAVSEASLQAEASGRITSVKVSLGDRVERGAVLGTIENTSAYASLLQAQGAYDAAIASTLQSETSLSEAKISVRNTYRDTFSTAENTVRNLLDEFFSNPDEERKRGLKFSGTGKSEELKNLRGEIGLTLESWSQTILDNNTGMTELEMLTRAETSITTISNMVTTLISIVNDDNVDSVFTDAELSSYSTRLVSTRSSLDGALTAISVARNVYNQATIQSTSGDVSQASALQKSALGTLRSAEAAYEKTIIRTPISGTVNALYIQQGEYVNQNQPTAIVANNGSLEVTTALGENDLKYAHVGDSVIINNTASGTITKIAPAIDPKTGKGEVKISTDANLELKNGSTVSVTLKQNGKNTTTVSDTIVIPLKALKMLASGPVVFGVTETNTLTSYPVTLGDLRGDAVEITGGITADSVIVTDARGLKDGDTVSIETQ